MNNNQTNTFNAGSHFKVLVPVSALENEITGTLVGSARCKTYPIFTEKHQIQLGKIML